MSRSLSLWLAALCVVLPLASAGAQGALTLGAFSDRLLWLQLLGLAMLALPESAVEALWPQAAAASPWGDWQQRIVHALAWLALALPLLLWALPRLLAPAA